MKKRFIAVVAMFTATVLTACTGDTINETADDREVVSPVLNNGAGTEESVSINKEEEDKKECNETDNENGGERGVIGTIRSVVDEDTVSVIPATGGDVVAGEELMCLAVDEKEAEAIAKLYGIKLANFSNGVATFTTDEDPETVIQRGKDNGYPELSRNDVIYLDDPVVKPIIGDTEVIMIDE